MPAETKKCCSSGQRGRPCDHRQAVGGTVVIRLIQEEGLTQVQSPTVSICRWARSRSGTFTDAAFRAARSEVSMTHDVQHALENPEVAAWILGALDPDDAAAFEEHLRSCKQCQLEAAELAPAARSLHFAAPAADPPPDLLYKVLAAVRYAVMAQNRTNPEPEPERPPEPVALRLVVADSHSNRDRRAARFMHWPAWTRRRHQLDRTASHRNSAARPRNTLPASPGSGRRACPRKSTKCLTASPFSKPTYRRLGAPSPCKARHEE